MGGGWQDVVHGRLGALVLLVDGGVQFGAEQYGQGRDVEEQQCGHGRRHRAVDQLVAEDHLQVEPQQVAAHVPDHHGQQRTGQRPPPRAPGRQRQVVERGQHRQGEGGDHRPEQDLQQPADEMVAIGVQQLGDQARSKDERGQQDHPAGHLSYVEL